MELSELFKISKDREVSSDFTTKLMTKLLQQERETTVTHVMLGMQVVASALQGSISTKAKPAYTYADYVNRGRPQRVVCYDTSKSRYIDIE